MFITLAQYYKDENGNNEGIKAVIDGKTWYVSLTNESNRYAEIMRQVEAGTLVIAEAE